MSYQPSPTVACVPAYHQLYATRPSNLYAFFFLGTPLPLQEVENNKLFKSSILALEPGMSIDYPSLPRHIRSFRAAISCTPSRKDLYPYFQHLLNLHDCWLKAGLLYYSYNVYAKMVHGLFITNSDPVLVAFTSQIPFEARGDVHRTQQRLSQITSQEEIQTELSTRRTDFMKATAALGQFKASPSLGPFLTTLVTTANRHDENVRVSRAVSASYHRDAAYKARRTRGYMLSALDNQFGWLGNSVMPQHLEDQVLEVHEQQMEELMPQYDQLEYEKEMEEATQTREKFKWMVAKDETACDPETGVWHGKSRMEI